MSGKLLNPGAKTHMTTGAPTTPTRVTPNNTSPRLPATRSVSSFTSSGLRVALYSDSTGTKASEKAPSPKVRRPKLGILKAWVKASMTMPAPKYRASTMSRTKPRMRDMRVIPPTSEVALKSTRDMELRILRNGASYGRHDTGLPPTGPFQEPEKACQAGA